MEVLTAKKISCYTGTIHKAAIIPKENASFPYTLNLKLTFYNETS